MKQDFKKIQSRHPGELLLILFAIILSYTSALDGGDFDVYLEAAYKLFHGQNPYLPPYAKDGMGYSYSPFFIILLIPFTSDYFLTEFVWCLLLCVMLYRSYVLFCHYLDEKPLEGKDKKIWIWLLLILSYQFVSNNIGMVQITIFLLWAILESLRLIKSNRAISGGLLLGAVINIKIMPVVMLGYLFYRGYFMSLTIAILTSVALLFLPSLFWGMEYNLTLLKDWWHIINPAHAEHQIEEGIGMHSMMSFLPVYLTETSGELPYPRNIFNFSSGTAVLITQWSIVLLGLISLLYFRSRPFIKETNQIKAIWEISYFLLLIPLVMPHQQKYAFLLVMPMVAYVLYFFLITKAWQSELSFKIVLAIFIIAMIVFSPIHGSDIIGRDAFRWSQHYRLITISTLMLIPVSLYCNPSKLKHQTIVLQEQNK
ncbi:MAG: glycosyltransferase family 87 protein [Saprospiraceae bacterium]|jgi:hypothetical protein|nr:DUF2029 domain-containing protein [Saprospiraceae bacterium]